MPLSYTSRRRSEPALVEDWGFKAGTVDILDIGSSGIQTLGRIDFNRFTVRRQITITQVKFNVTVVGVTPTAGQNWIGIYNSSGVLLAKVNTDANVTTGNENTATFSSPLTLPAGTYYVAILWNAATGPTVHRITLSTNAMANINQGSKALYGSLPAPNTDLPASVDLTALGVNFNIWGMWFL